MLKVAMPFTDHMVLQRNKPIAIWGTSDKAVEIQANLGTLCESVMSDENGNWTVIFSAMEAATDLTLTIRSEHETLELRDVCIGEVWLAAGQSNMEYLLGFEEHYESLLDVEMPKHLRFFNTPQVANERQRKELDYANDGFWRCCTKDDLGWFSAIGYYFGKELQQCLDVPIGILGCNWGGTNCCTWMDPKYLRGTAGECWLELEAKTYKDVSEEFAYNAFQKTEGYDRTDMLHEAFGNMAVKHSLSVEEQRKLMEEQTEVNPFMELPYERRPGCLYNTMVQLLIPYGIRGVIWYQGESDAGFPEAYRDVFAGLVSNWREMWNDDFPFIFAQLAPFYRWLGCTADGYVELRDAQEAISKTVSGCYLTANGDAGMKWDIHPKNKIPVAHRMALIARHYAYGEEIECEAPRIDTIAVEGKRLILSFVNAEGLYVSGNQVNALKVVDEHGDTIIIKDFWVNGQQLVMELESDKKACKVLFAREGFYEINLYNRAEIPALPFEKQINN